jgi:hypothetical protein
MISRALTLLRHGPPSKATDGDSLAYGRKECPAGRAGHLRRHYRVSPRIFSCNYGDPTVGAAATDAERSSIPRPRGILAY